MSPEILVEVGAAAGYAGGMLAEQFAVRRAAQQHHIFTEAAGLALAEAGTHKATIAQRISRTILAPLALVGAVAGGVEILANQPGAPTHATKPVVELAIDHSGATLDAPNSTPVIDVINNFATLVMGENSYVKVAVAKGGNTRDIRSKDLSNDRPFGDAPVAQALQNALDKAGHDTLPTTLNGPRHEGAAVFITNGNTIPGDSNLISQANLQGTPVNVINVEKTDKDLQYTELKNLAAKTHGKYWSANDSNIKAISKNIKASLRPNLSQHQPTPNRRLLNVFGLVLLAAMSRQFIGRANNTTGRGAKGE